MRRLPLRAACLLAALSVTACGEPAPPPPPAPRLEVAGPVAARTESPLPLAVVRGRADAARSLDVRVDAGDEHLVFETRPGATFAFRAPGEAPPGPVALPGLEPETPAQRMDLLRTRLAEAVPDATLREVAGGDVFLVDLPPGPAKRIARVVATPRPTSDLRFLIEVLPRAMYRPWRDNRAPPRLAAPPYPWNGTDEAFDAYKQAEVARWRAAREKGEPYVPSRSDLLVLPREGTEARDVHDFAVLEWPQDAADRFDGRILLNAREGRDPYSGRPVVLYDVREPYRKAFQAWTKANVGLPMAILLDWRVRSAPIVNSPLSDSVQVTLGSGSFRDLEAEARRLVGALGGQEAPGTDDLRAVVLRPPDGALEVLLPLSEGVETTLGLEAQGAGSAEPVRVERTFRRASDAVAPVADTVDVRLAEILLGTPDVRPVEPLLQRDAAGAVTRLAFWAGRKDAPVRRLAAIDLLGRVDPASKSAAHVLVAQMDDADPDVPPWAIRSLHGLARQVDAAFEALLHVAATGDERLAGAAGSALSGLGEQRDGELRARADDADPGVRAAVLIALGHELEDASVVPLLVAHLRDDAAQVRRAALAFLQLRFEVDPGSVRPHVDAIAARLADADRDVRLAAVRTLAGIGADAVAAARPFAHADEARTRAAALYALGGQAPANPEVADLVERALDDPALPVRLAAAGVYLAAGNTQRPLPPVDPARLARVLPILEEALASPDFLDRRVAVVALWRAGPAAGAAAGAVVPLLDDAEEPVRVYAAAALERMGKGDVRTREILDAVKADPRNPLHDIGDWVD